jgi:hypothetical protein
MMMGNFTEGTEQQTTLYHKPNLQNLPVNTGKVSLPILRGWLGNWKEDDMIDVFSSLL